MERDFMPIQKSGQLDLRLRRGERVVHVNQIPRELFVDAHETVCRRFHDQSLDDIARRGGFDAAEAVCVLACLPKWTDCGGEEQAHRLLYATIWAFNRGQRVAEAKAKELAS